MYCMICCNNCKVWNNIIDNMLHCLDSEVASVAGRVVVDKWVVAESMGAECVAGRVVADKEMVDIEARQ